MKFTVVTRVRPNSISIRGYRVGNKRVLIAGAGIGATGACSTDVFSSIRRSN